MGKDNRREHARYRLWLPARIGGAEPDESTPTTLAIGHDMSQGGSLLVTNVELRVGANIEMYVRIPHDAPEETVLGATVVRCTKNHADPHGLWPYEVAVSFHETNPDLEQLLREQVAVLEGMHEP
jgi:hypothetical protein